MAKRKPTKDMEKIRQMDEMEKSIPVQVVQREKGSNFNLWVLLVVCATFLTIVYTNSQLNQRIDKLQTDQERIVMSCAAYAEYIQSPFCYGFDAQGQKGYAVDERKVNTACKGFENYTVKK